MKHSKWRRLPDTRRLGTRRKIRKENYETADNRGFPPLALTSCLTRLQQIIRQQRLHPKRHIQPWYSCSASSSPLITITGNFGCVLRNARTKSAPLIPGIRWSVITRSISAGNSPL